MILEEITSTGRRYAWSLDGEAVPEPVVVHDGPLAPLIRLREEPWPVFEIRDGPYGPTSGGLHTLSATDASGKTVSVEVGWYGGRTLHVRGLKSGTVSDWLVARGSLESIGEEGEWDS